MNFKKKCNKRCTCIVHWFIFSIFFIQVKFFKSNYHHPHQFIYWHRPVKKKERTSQLFRYFSTLPFFYTWHNKSKVHEYKIKVVCKVFKLYGLNDYFIISMWSIKWQKTLIDYYLHSQVVNLTRIIKHNHYNITIQQSRNGQDYDYDDEKHKNKLFVCQFMKKNDDRVIVIAIYHNQNYLFSTLTLIFILLESSAKLSKRLKCFFRYNLIMFQTCLPWLFLLLTHSARELKKVSTPGVYE